MLPARSTLPEVPPLAPVLRGEGPAVRGRARRFAWPARGTERFLGRNVFKIPLREWRPCRRCMGTCSGLIPYSCWVPPRSIADEWTPLLEPSRRRHRRLRSVRNKTDANDYDAENHSEVSPWKERSSTLQGPDSGSARIIIQATTRMPIGFLLPGSGRSRRTTPQESLRPHLPQNVPTALRARQSRNP